MPKNRVKVVIAGNTYELQGAESNEHITRVAEFINNKVLELKRTHVDQPQGTMNSYVLAAINVADEHIKLQDKLTLVQSEVEEAYKGLDGYMKENIALKERIAEMALEITQLKLQAKI